MAPINAVCKALIMGRLPVKCPFANPNTSSAIMVTITEATTPSSAASNTMYGDNGTNPPIMYDTAIVIALITALCGSGFSKPSSNLRPSTTLLITLHHHSNKPFL